METYQPSWRGKNLCTRKDSEGKYMAMIGTDALLYVPIKIEQNSTYRVKILASVSSGNGIVYCNIYGSKKFDFPQRSFVCKLNKWETYNFEIKTGSFPNTVPMVFRLWRKPNGTGTVLIRKIFVELVEKEEYEVELPTKINNNIPILDESGRLVENVVCPVERSSFPVNKPKSNLNNNKEKSSKELDRELTRQMYNELNKDFNNTNVDANNSSSAAPYNKPRSKIPRRAPRTYSEHMLRKVPSKSSMIKEHKHRLRKIKRMVKPHMKRALKVLTQNLPHTTDLVPSESGFKNSVIISVKDRKDFLDRTLFSYGKQTMPKDEFELIIVDDNSTDDLLSVCKKHSEISGLQFQYIKVDSTKGAIKQGGFTPALTNNIGFKNARGSVFINQV
jgi:hypothetical protein